MPRSIKPKRRTRTRAFVGTFHAKTHFSQLIERVANGEEITITKHDRPVAKLVPADRPSRDHLSAVFRRMDDLRKSLPKAKDRGSLRDMIHEGRRF